MAKKYRFIFLFFGCQMFLELWGKKGSRLKHEHNSQSCPFWTCIKIKSTHPRLDAWSLFFATFGLHILNIPNAWRMHILEIGPWNVTMENCPVRSYTFVVHDVNNPWVIVNDYTLNYPIGLDHNNNEDPTSIANHVGHKEHAPSIHMVWKRVFYCFLFIIKHALLKVLRIV